MWNLRYYRGYSTIVAQYGREITTKELFTFLSCRGRIVAPKGSNKK